MARINLDETYWGDPRRSRLLVAIGCVFKADGAVINAWKLAEHYWVPRREVIPMSAWTGAGFPMELITCGFAREESGGIYVSGTKEKFAWRFERKEAGKLGGRNSAKTRKKPGKKPAEAKPSKRKQKQPSSSPSPSSSSSSSSSTSISPSPSSSPSDSASGSPRKRKNETLAETIERLRKENNVQSPEDELKELTA